MRFAGYVQGEDLARLLNGHRVLVVPSRWAEPFGLVGLLGVSCGCFVIASETGGLGEAIGPGGVMVPNGNAARLAEEIERGLARPGEGQGTSSNSRWRESRRAMSNCSKAR